jgi:hypothetical protein
MGQPIDILDGNLAAEPVGSVVRVFLMIHTHLVDRVVCKQCVRGVDCLGG